MQIEEKLKLAISSLFIRSVLNELESSNENSEKLKKQLRLVVTKYFPTNEEQIILLELVNKAWSKANEEKHDIYISYMAYAIMSEYSLLYKKAKVNEKLFKTVYNRYCNNMVYKIKKSSDDCAKRAASIINKVVYDYVKEGLVSKN